jgi:hypothetical protein
MEKPRIRLIFRFSAFFEALLLNQYQSVGLSKDIKGYQLRNGHFYDGDDGNNKTYILNKTNGKSHSR